MKKVISETPEYIIFEDSFENKPIRFHFNKQTDELRICVEDACNAIGLNFIELLGSDAGLDFIINAKKENPDIELFGDNGIFQKME